MQRHSVAINGKSQSVMPSRTKRVACVCLFPTARDKTVTERTLEMAAAPRKSSIGNARRGIQKAHIPYRGDNPAVGKKTGIAVRNVERKSDGFEPFEEVMQQADKRTPPPLAKARKRKKSVAREEDRVDENGEMSMELDNSPMPYFENARRISTPNISRVLSTSRIVTRTPETNFDTVPSPRPRSLSRRSIGGTGAGPSRLSKVSSARHSSPEFDAIDNALHNRDDTNGISHARFSLPPSSPQDASFMQMDQDDDDDEGNEPFQEPEVPHVPEEPEEELSSRSKSKQNKEKASKPAKKKAREEEPNDVASPTYDDPPEPAPQEEQSPEPDPAPKMQKGKNKAVQDGSNSMVERTRNRSKKENRPYREGVRRSTREHIKPLEWWRGERYVYGRDRSTTPGPVYVAPIKEIMRIPKEPAIPLGSKRKRSSGRARSKSRMVEQPPVGYNPEEGWDDNTSDIGVILEYPGGEDKERRITFTSSMFDPQLAANNEWSYQKIFGDGDFIAAGQLTIPVAGRKPSKSSKDNTYVFYIAEGAVNFKVHDTSFVLSSGAMIMVPRGNTYYIENIADREAKLVFTQARKLAPTEEEIQHQQMVNNRRSTEWGN